MPAMRSDGSSGAPARSSSRTCAARISGMFQASSVAMRWYGARRSISRGGVADDVVAFVGEANHQGRLAFMVGNDRIVREQQPGIRPREPGEDQPGHQRHREDPREQLDRGDEMSVMGLRRDKAAL